MKIYRFFGGEIEILGGKIQIWVGKIDFGGFEIRTKLDFWRSRKIGSKFFGVRKSKVFVRNPKIFLVNSGSKEHFKLVFGSGNSDLAKIRPLKI